MPVIKTGPRVVVSVRATESGDWQVVSTPTGFLGITSAYFSDNDYIHGFVRFENGEDWEEYDTDDDTSTGLLQISNITGTVTIARPATPYDSSNSGDRVNAGSGTHTLTISPGSGTMRRIFREINGSWKTLTSGDATPSLADYRLFKTAGTTAITAFDDMEAGKLFIVRRGASDITIEDGAGISLPGDNDITLTVTNPAAIFVEDNGVAYLVGTVGTDVLDEDDFSSDSATKPPSQQSTKAYVARVPNIVAESTVAIATGAVTATGPAHVLAAESGTADSLDTVTMTAFPVGGVTRMRPDTGDTITVTSGVGNITTDTGASIILDAVTDYATFTKTASGVVASIGGLSAPTYLAPSASNPTTRSDGTALSGGEVYFNTTAANQALRAYVGGWGRIAAGITPKMLGAVADEDGTGAGTDDSTALNNAITLAYNLGWGVVDGEGLWYNAAAARILLKDGVQLRNIKIYWDGGVIANQRIVYNGGNSGTYRLKNVTVHRGASKDDNVPANLSTTAPDTTSHSGIDLRRNSGSFLRVEVEDCEVYGHGVGSGIIIGGANGGGFVRGCRVHDMEWNAEATTTPSDVGFSDVIGNDGINGIFFFDCDGLDLYGNNVRDIKVSYDDGGGAASFCLGGRGIAAGVGAGGGNQDCAIYNNIVRRVSQGIDITGGTTDGANKRFKIYANTVEDVYSWGIKGANCFVYGLIFNNTVRRAGLGGIVLQSSADNAIVASAQTKLSAIDGNKVIDTGLFDIDIPADHNSGSGFTKATDNIFAIGVNQLGGTYAVSHPWGCIAKNNEIYDDNNLLTTVYFSNVTVDNTIQRLPNCHYGTVLYGAAHLDNETSLTTGPWNPRVVVYLEANEAISNGAGFVDLPWDAAVYDDHGMFDSGGTPANVKLPFAGNYRYRFLVRTVDSTDAVAKVQANIQVDRAGVGSWVTPVGGLLSDVATSDSTYGAAAIPGAGTIRVSKDAAIKLRVAHGDSAPLDVRGPGASQPIDGTARFLEVLYLPDAAGGVDWVERP